jgi:N-formylglutamate deformylase
VTAALFAPSHVIHGPSEPRVPLVLDSPHSGFDFPPDFGSRLDEFDLREGEDCFVDQLYLPAIERGVGVFAALAPRTYIDLNRHAADIDLALIEGGRWPGEHVPSGKARLGKALIWRTLDDGRDIYDRKLSVDEVQRRIRTFHQPYHHAVRDRIEATRARFGRSWHINCHSMNAVSGAQGEGGPGRARVELVRAYSNPAEGRMSLQLEINKRLYMDEATRTRSAGFEPLQRQLMSLIDAVLEYATGELAAAAKR